MSEENIAVVRRLIEEAWNQGRLEVIDEGSVGHDPAVGGDYDRESVKQQVQMYCSAFPDLRLEIEDIFACDDKVVMRWRSEGTFENELRGRQTTRACPAAVSTRSATGARWFARWCSVRLGDRSRQGWPGPRFPG